MKKKRHAIDREMFHDFSIIDQDSQEHKVSKVILANASDAFMNIVTNLQCSEGSDDTLQIIDFDGVTIEDAINYMFNGQIDYNSHLKRFFEL